MGEKTIVILISGRGSNMEAILRARLPIRIACVISNEPDAHGLATARAQGVATAVVPHREFRDRADFEAALAASVDVHQPDLIVLAGFMRILSDGLIARYQGRLINIHPSLLPAFPGLHTHRHALAAGVRIHGCTVHFVTPAVDRGPIIVQAAVPVLPGDSEEALSARVLREEHRIYPQAIRWFCEGRLSLSPDGMVTVRGAQAGENALRSPVVE
jgi:phosphoribosylglycinamide formyltransferase-1